MDLNTCIIWDWNGTLLDDTSACVGALNEMLAERGREPLTLEYFRDHFAFPARRFYAFIGLDVPDSEWQAHAREYHERYARQPGIRLNDEARAALERVRASGARQVVLSALHQRLLEADLARYGIREYFDRVVGSDNFDGASKLERGRELLAQLGEGRYVLIGDSLHDLEVATALGIECVLVATGGHSYARLAAAGRAERSLLSALSVCGFASASDAAEAGNLV